MSLLFPDPHSKVWFPKFLPGLMGRRIRTGMGVLGEYIAHRVLHDDREPELAAGFRLKDEEFGQVSPS